MRRTVLVALSLPLFACGKRAPSHAIEQDAGAPVEASAPVAPAFPMHTLASWTIEKDQSAFIVGVDAAHTRAIVRVDGRSDYRPAELVTIDWTAHTTTRVTLHALGQSTTNFGDPETVRELAAYATALRGARAFDGRVNVADDAVFVESAGDLYRAGLDGKDARLFAAEAKGATVSPHGDAIAYVSATGVRVTRAASPPAERRIDVANAQSLTFSPDARTLYFAAGADRAKRCLTAANLVSGAVTKLACATVVEPMEILMAPNGKRAALFVSGGPSGIAVEMIIVSLPEGHEEFRKKLEWSMETYVALTDDGDVIGTTWTNQWGSPGAAIAVLAHDPAHPMGSGASDGFTVGSIALETAHTVLAVATKRTGGGPTQIELAEVPLGP